MVNATVPDLLMYLLMDTACFYSASTEVNVGSIEVDERLYECDGEKKKKGKLEEARPAEGKLW